MSRPGIEPVTSHSLEQTLYLLSYRAGRVLMLPTYIQACYLNILLSRVFVWLKIVPNLLNLQTIFVPSIRSTCTKLLKLSCIYRSRELCWKVRKLKMIVESSRSLGGDSVKWRWDSELPLNVTASVLMSESILTEEQLNATASVLMSESLLTE